MCSFSAVLILYVRSQTCGLLTKNVVLTQRYPKTCGLKSVNISATASATNSIFCTTHIHWPADLHYNLTPHPLSLFSTPPNLPQISPFFKISPFRVVHWQIHFFCWPKNFSTPRTRRILELQTANKFLRSTDSVVSSDTLKWL